MVKKFISHRGNLYGKDLERENNLNSILEVINNGFDCEIDLWLHDNKLYLGHDRPENIISFSTILEIKKYIWIHCKNLEALNFFIEKESGELNFFWHQQDDFTLTSLNYIWTYPKKEVTSNSVIVDLIHVDKIKKNVFGICSDNIATVKKMYS